MKYIRLVGAAFAAMAAAAAMSAPALAGPTYTFSLSTGAQPSNVAKITLAQGNTTSQVLPACTNSGDCVTIDLKFVASNYGILGNGGHISFGFQLNSTVETAITRAINPETLAIGWADPTGGSFTNSFGRSGTFSLDTSGGSQPSFGSFDTSLDDTAGSGSSKGYYGELKFVLECTAHCGTVGLDTNDFVQNNSHVYFTADLTDGDNTGAQAWETRRVPEPGTILLFGSALAALGLKRRRRPSKTA